jgi:hypothetical protein
MSIIMKKTIILSKGGLDAVATARNIIMELYSTLNKIAARLSMNFAAFKMQSLRR